MRKLVHSVAVSAKLRKVGGGGLRVVVEEGVKDRVGEDSVLVIELVVVRGFFVYMVSF